MAKRRDLKKSVNYICGELFAECVALMLYKNDVKKEDFNNLVARILEMRSEFVSRISHTQPSNTKGFYKKLNQDFRVQVEEILNLIGNLD